MKKFILNCAVTGAIHTPTMAPYLPIKPQDIAVSSQIIFKENLILILPK